MRQKKSQSPADFNRRKFLGLSAMATAALYGSTVFSLSSCKKDSYDPYVPPGTNPDPDDNGNTIYGEDTDVVVIGSGFGGAVSALRMTEAGLNTIMLEMGKQYEIKGNNKPFSETFSPDGRSTWLKNKTIVPVGPALPIMNPGLGVLDRVDFPNMRIYRGTCLGGGSVVYGAMLPWANDLLWHNEFPDIDYSEMTSVWYPKVASIIPRSVVPNDILQSKNYKFARVGLEQCTKAGMQQFYIPSGSDFNIIRDEIEGRIPKCVTNADLLYGVNNGAKHSVDRNYIPAALGTGKLTIQTTSKVEQIVSLSDGRYEIQINRINEKGKTIKTHTIRSKYVFVCAGVVGTNSLLLRSQNEGGLPDLEHIGERVGTNGNIMSVRTVNEDVGAHQCTFPVSGYFQPDNPYGVFLAEQPPLPFGFETRSLLVLGVTVNEYRGTFKYDEGNKAESASLDWDVNGLEQGTEAVKYFTEKLLNSNGGGKVRTSYFPKDGYSNNFTYHPLGGVVRGRASDEYGRLKGYKNIYCVDGAMVPGSTCGANPALTIAAIAERCLDNIVKNDLF